VRTSNEQTFTSFVYMFTKLNHRRTPSHHVNAAQVPVTSQRRAARGVPRGDEY